MDGVYHKMRKNQQLLSFICLAGILVESWSNSLSNSHSPPRNNNRQRIEKGGMNDENGPLSYFIIRTLQPVYPCMIRQQPHLLDCDPVQLQQPLRLRHAFRDKQRVQILQIGKTDKLRILVTVYSIHLLNLPQRQIVANSP